MNIEDYREVMSIKDKFSRDRHGEKIELVNVRYKYAFEFLKEREKNAEKRHKERLEILKKKNTKTK